MDVNAVIEQINAQAQNVEPVGATFKFKLDDHVIFIDGTGEKNVVSADDNPADCTISTSIENMIKLKNGELNPMMAVMTGKVKIEGDMGLAMKLQSLI